MEHCSFRQVQLYEIMSRICLKNDLLILDIVMVVSNKLLNIFSTHKATYFYDFKYQQFSEFDLVFVFFLNRYIDLEYCFNILYHTGDTVVSCFKFLSACFSNHVLSIKFLLCSKNNFPFV